MSDLKTILKANNLKLGYRKGPKETVVAENISFELKAGELTCLLGPNGVGKSTLLKAIHGQNPPLEGDVLLEGKALSSFDQRSLARKISVVLTEKISSANLTVGQLVGLGRTPHTGWLGRLSPADKMIVENAISVTNTQYLHDRRLSELSDGQLQKVMIARALAQDGELMILDEPTAHLDLVNRYEVMHLLREIAQRQNKAILVVTHDLDIAIDTADQFWIMQCGAPLSTGSPEDLILKNKINLLLPSAILQFSKELGKVEPIVDRITVVIDGVMELRKWVILALRKANLERLDSSTKIIINSEEDFTLDHQGHIYQLNSISEVIQKLKKSGL
ncbi:ABC transporter ATP-binding protein [Litoribacter ruber]|uniref:ABC transporter ATP-binding protein n=1 Tax=Litoribacter ruber TaxID=702568 RepID=UPI001BD9DE2C|nr:ABC transporter ATP-binding protein [Litoribacter ruber]MBT0811915.1 ABC transporter ATP-binding protein [Litoribacter ruber]